MFGLVTLYASTMELWGLSSCFMMTPRCVNVFRNTGPLRYGSIGHQWFSLAKGSHVTFDAFFDAVMNKLLKKQSSCRWFEMLQGLHAAFPIGIQIYS